ncbi:MAG: hypothetical protein ACK4K0_04605 [Flavobacteriales bacterium]
MITKALTAIFLALSFTSISQISVSDFSKKFPNDDTKAIQAAFDYLDSLGHGSLDFDGTKKYRIYKSIELPRYKTSGRRIFVINGNGCEIIAKPGFSIFNRIPKDQKEALEKMMSTRFSINDFTFTQGDKAINLGATFGSNINRCNFVAQYIAAIDIQFGLSTEINHCIATNCKSDAFVLRTGEDWGGNTNNSQSNHSVVNMCRVYAAKGAKTSFKILGSGGVALRDIISEGSNEVDYAVYFDKLSSSTVRMFSILNFHLEHSAKEAAIYIRNTGVTSIEGVYYQKAYAEFPLIHAAAGTDLVSLKYIPHYVAGTILKADNNDVIWRLEHCHNNFYEAANWRVKSKEGYQKKIPFYMNGIKFRGQNVK